MMKTGMKYGLIIAMAGLSAIIPFGISSAGAYHDDRTSRGSDDPSIAVIGDTAYVVWNESTNPQFWDVYFREIADGTMQEPVNLTKGTSFYPKPQILVSEGNVYVLWEDRQSPQGDDAVFFTKSNDSGKTFDKPREIAPTNGDTTIYRPLGIETSGNTVYIFASNWNRETQQNRIIYLASTDHGDTFSGPVTLFNHDQSDQGIQVEAYKDTIYVMSDDRADYDEKGSLYLRKILPDGTLTDIVNVNGGATAVTQPQFAVHGDDIYVSWRDRVEQPGNGVHERWYPAFAKSDDGGETFGEPIILETDPKSIDTVGTEGGFVFADGDSVYVFFKSEYWDGQNQTFKMHLAYSHNKGDDFDVIEHPMNELIKGYGAIMSFQGDGLYSIALTAKNPPQNDAAAYFAQMGSDNSYAKPLDLFSGVSTQAGMPSMPISGIPA